MDEQAEKMKTKEKIYKIVANDGYGRYLCRVYGFKALSSFASIGHCKNLWNFYTPGRGECWRFFKQNRERQNDEKMLIRVKKPTEIIQFGREIPRIVLKNSGK